MIIITDVNIKIGSFGNIIIMKLNKKTCTGVVSNGSPDI